MELIVVINIVYIQKGKKKGEKKEEKVYYSVIIYVILYCIFRLKVEFFVL